MSDLLYHHIGMPADTPGDGETFLSHLSMHVQKHDTNPLGIQWIKTTSASPPPEQAETAPLTAFKTGGLLPAMADKYILIEPDSYGASVVFTFLSDAPAEFM